MKLITAVLLSTVVSGKTLISAIDETTTTEPTVIVQPVVAPAKTTSVDSVTSSDVKITPIPSQTTATVVPVDTGVQVPIQRQVSPQEAIVNAANAAIQAAQAAQAEAARKQKEAEEKAKQEAERKAKEEAEAYAKVVAARWETVENTTYYSRQIWLGMFAGFYGMSMKAVKPTDDCFGPWVTESMHELVNFGWDLEYNFWNLTFAESETAAYDVVDLLFRNDEYCHFRTTYWEIYDFCQIDGNCEDIWTNVQTNAFSIITQLTASLAAMKAKPWDQLAKEQKGYVLNTMGKSVAQIVSDLVGFSQI